MAEDREKAPSQLSFIEKVFLKGIGISVGTVLGNTATAPIERVTFLLQNQGELLKQGRISRPYTGAIDCASQIYRNEYFHSFWRGNLTNCIARFSSKALDLTFSNRIKAMFKVNRNDSYMVGLAKNIAGGGVAAAISLCFVYSLDYAYIRLASDVQNAIAGVAERKYIGLFDVYKQTLATDGIVGLYRGFVIACVNIFVYRGCYFGLYDILRPLIGGPNVSFRRSFLLGYVVTITAGLISYPFSTIQHRMMMTSGEVIKYEGAIDCMFQIIQSEGASALFNGAGVNVIRGIAGAGILAGLDKLVELYTSIKTNSRNNH